MKANMKAKLGLYSHSKTIIHTYTWGGFGDLQLEGIFACLSFKQQNPSLPCKTSKKVTIITKMQNFKVANQNSDQILNKF